MTIYTRISTLGETFRLEASTVMPEGTGPVEISGSSRDAVLSELSRQLKTDEKIVVREFFPAFDIGKA